MCIRLDPYLTTYREIKSKYTEDVNINIKIIIIYIINYNKVKVQTSGQDGGIGRYSVSSHNQKEDKKKFKNKNNQNCQKIELCGSLTTKGLKKKISSTLVGGVEMGSWGGEDTWQGDGLGRQGDGWWTGWSHLHMWIS